MNRLREVRVIKRITQFQLRLSTGIHQSKISLIENGLIEPYDDEKKRIVEALGIKVVEIWVESYTRHECPNRQTSTSCKEQTH